MADAVEKSVRLRLASGADGAAKDGLAFDELLQICLALQLGARCALLRPFLQLYRQVAGDAGVVSVSQFTLLAKVLQDSITKQELQAFAHRADPRGTGLVTFSECVEILLPLIQRLHLRAPLASGDPTEALDPPRDRPPAPLERAASQPASSPARNAGQPQEKAQAPSPVSPRQLLTASRAREARTPRALHTLLSAQRAWPSADDRLDSRRASSSGRSAREGDPTEKLTRSSDVAAFLAARDARATPTPFAELRRDQRSSASASPHLRVRFASADSERRAPRLSRGHSPGLGASSSSPSLRSVPPSGQPAHKRLSPAEARARRR